MRQLLLRIAVATALIGSLVSTTASAVVASSGSPGDETIVITVNDSEAGGSYDVTFELVFEDATADGTPVYIYIPEGALADESVDWINPSFDPNPDDEFVPCPSKFQEGDYLVTQEQINALGEELVKEEGIVEVDEAHFGPIGLADDSDPNSDALVVLVYNVQDTFYYDCAEDVYTAGYFAPEYITDAGMNVIVIDAFDWANRIGEQDPDNPDGRPFLYEGVIAHELEHLLMNYSDAGELSWVDEGLADFAAFLNGYPPGGSHITYHQVFHRETSLTRWGGGLENYGASFSFMLYLWEQAGGNGDGTLTPDKQYDDAGGDLLIKLIFEEQADGMEGIQNAIDTYNALTGHGRPPVCRGPVQGLGHRALRRRRVVRPVQLRQPQLRRSRHDHLDDPAGQRPVLQEPRHVQGQRPAGPVPERSARASADGAALRHELRDVPQPGWHLRGHLGRGRHDGHRAAHR